MTGHPEFDAMMERAYRYRYEVQHRTGEPPAIFVVSAREYALLQYWHLPWRGVDATGPMELFGMPVVVSQPIMPVDEYLRMDMGPIMTPEFDQAVTRLMARLEEAGQAAADEPLPPLDDLDEGLHCCGRTHPTFAAFMAHRRQHGELAQ